ncbi:MAG: O-acetyl-ADP-ribose deacetylase [Bacteroidota bacterium]
MMIELHHGDITKQSVDIIVNAANTSLLGGGGVDGAIHRAGGPAILVACREIRNRQGGCAVGEAVITTGGNLPCQHVIHTVGPRWNAGRSEEASKLADCYDNSLRLAEEQGAQSIAFPNISTGIYRFPKEQAAIIAIEAVRAHQARYLDTVVFVCFDQENYDIYLRLLS